jgi:23S rRNA pseudouridine2605 synthase
LTAEQLQAARAAHWRQKQNPLLTLEDAERWLEQHPLCLYLPRRTQLPAPAPSFVEACMGSTLAAPSLAAIEQAQGLLTRLVASGSVVALNLLGAVSEQPDFLAHSQALPYVLCLRADADWKHAPQKSSGHKVSPLVLELWKALDKEGVLSAAQAKETLGRELTEAAILRGLCELWQALRISPVFADAGQPAQWELLRVRHRDALSTATSTSQVTALSLLVSMYLQSVYAASSEEIEIFLSPVASRSRVREAVRGLAATRQIHSLSMDAQTYYFLEGGLPEFAELVAPATASTEPLAPAAGVIARVETPRRPLAAQRTDRPARPMRTASPSGRPAKPTPFAPRPAAPPRSGAAPSPARTEWTGPRRPAGRPAATGGSRPERVAGKRPSRPPGRSFPPRTTGEPGRGAGVPRTGARPDTGGRGRPDTRPDKRAAGWAGSEKRERPVPSARPSARPGPGPSAGPSAKPREGSASAPRPPYTGDRSRSPFREGQKPRPGSRSGAGSGPRGAGGDRLRGTAPGQPSSGRREGFTPRAGSNRPWPAKRPPAAGRPQGRPPVPFRSKPSGSGSAGPRSNAPRPDAPRSGPPTRVTGRPGGGSGRGSYERPRAGGYAKTGGYTKTGRASNPRSEGGDQRGNQGPRPPLTPSARPAKSWPRAGSTSGRPGGRPAGRSSGKPGGKPRGKTGKPPARFHGSKPKGKKPGA